MPNGTRIEQTLFGSPANTNPRLAGANLDRQSKFVARAARRWGDWDDYLVFPLPLLWLDPEPVACFYDECVFAPPAIIELWP